MTNITLCIDTASPAFALALAMDGEVVESLQRDSNQDHSRLLLPAIDEIFGGRKRELGGIVVVRGPGNYAGLRVGIATGEGLALALGIPIAGVGTLEAVAAAANVDQCLAIHPAGRGEWAAQRFLRGRADGELRAASASDLEGDLYGEGASELGGTDVPPLMRAGQALTIGLARLHEATGTPDAIYLREPHITRPKRERPRIARG